VDKREAIELLQQKLAEIARLRGLPCDNDSDNKEFKLLRYHVADIIETAFGKDSSEYKRIPIMPIKTLTFRQTDAEREQEYNGYLDSYEICLKSIIQKYEKLGIEIQPTVIEERPKAFIAHGGESPSLNKLKQFLEALGVEPLVAEEQPSEGRSVGENVDWYARQADCAVILATKGDIDGKTGGFIPRGNVLIEIGKSQELFKDRIIYLLQAGTKFPTNISEKVWGRFTTQRMDDAFIKIARELKKFGILRVVKPKRRGVDV